MFPRNQAIIPLATFVIEEMCGDLTNERNELILDSQGSAQGLDINSQGSAQEESTSFDAFGRARAWISDRTTPASGGGGDNDRKFNEK